MSITFTAPGAIAADVYVSMTDDNARRVMGLLGLPAAPTGACEADDLLGRATMARALIDAATDDALGRSAVVAGNWTECGTAPGYVAMRLAELADLAAYAHNRGAPVTWS